MNTKKNVAAAVLTVALLSISVSTPVAAQEPQAVETGDLQFIEDGKSEFIQLGEPTTAPRADVAQWLAGMDSEGHSSADIEDLMIQAGLAEDTAITTAFLDSDGGFIGATALSELLIDYNLMNMESSNKANIIAFSFITTLIKTEANKEVTCTGGSATILGWADYAYVAGTPVHVQNSPASSYYSIVYDVTDDAIISIDGYTRSAMDNVVFEYKAGAQLAYWDWNSVPMGGSAGIGFSCVYVGTSGVITSVSVSVSGTPLGLPVGSVLSVSADGTTCIVPC